MTKTETLKILSLFTTAIPNIKISDVQLNATCEVWMLVIGDLPFELAQTAALTVLRNWRLSCLPPPAEVVQAVLSIQQLSMPLPMEAWAEVSNAIGRYGAYFERDALKSLSPMVREVVERLGWHELATSEDPRGVLRSHFMKAYEAHIEREKDLATLPEAAKSLMGAERKAIQGSNK